MSKLLLYSIAMICSRKEKNGPFQPLQALSQSNWGDPACIWAKTGHLQTKIYGSIIAFFSPSPAFISGSWFLRRPKSCWLSEWINGPEYGQVTGNLGFIVVAENQSLQYVNSSATLILSIGIIRCRQKGALLTCGPVCIWLIISY